MPLLPGKSKGVISRNIGELVHSKASPARAKGIKTLASKMGLSYGKAKARQAVAIAYAKARKR